MTLQIRNHPDKLGYALLVFDREINADSLMLAVYNMMRREYLAHSIVKAIWTPSQTHFFKATLVEHSQGRSTFLIGPEITSFIPDETSIELISETPAIRERAVWSGIWKDFGWKPDPQVDPDEAKKKAAREQEARRQREEDERKEKEDAARRADEARRADARRREEEEAAARQEAERLRLLSEVKPPPLPRSYGKPLAALAAIAVLAAALFWGSQNKDLLCDGFNLFCSADTLAYRKADACAKPLSCGAGACIADYRREFPQGRFKAQIDRIATEKGAVCVDRVELSLFNSAKACADDKRCGARSCFAEYRRIYPDGPHKADIDRLDAAKGADCPVDAELQMFERAKACAAPMICGAESCIADYRRTYPNGRFKADIDRIATEKPPCPDPELRVVERAEACARSLSCGVEAACLTEYRRSYPGGGTYKARIDRLAAEKGQPCRDLEGETYQRAQQCADRLTGNCGAGSCIAEYRREYPNGRFKAQIDRIEAEKGRSCLATPPVTPPAVDQLPPFNPRPRDQDAGLNCDRLQNPEPIEQMICADADLARANADLERVWRGMQPTQRQRLRQGQRDWIERRDSDCSIPRSGNWDQTALRRIKNCFIEKTRARTNELQ